MSSLVEPFLHDECAWRASRARAPSGVHTVPRVMYALNTTESSKEAKPWFPGFDRGLGVDDLAP